MQVARKRHPRTEIFGMGVQRSNVLARMQAVGTDRSIALCDGFCATIFGYVLVDRHTSSALLLTIGSTMGSDMVAACREQHDRSTGI